MLHPVGPLVPGHLRRSPALHGIWFKELPVAKEGNQEQLYLLGPIHLLGPVLEPAWSNRQHLDPFSAVSEMMANTLLTSTTAEMVLYKFSLWEPPVKLYYLICL